MATVNAHEVRLPRWVRDAVTRHDQVVVLNGERPVLAMVHPDDLPPHRARHRGRAVSEIASLLAGVPTPDPDFAKDMDAVLASSGPVPTDSRDRQ